MRILFDHGVPAPLRRFLHAHAVTLAKELGWERLVNGDLLDAAEEADFDVLVTADKKMRYQQNFTERNLALVVLRNAQWPVAKKHVNTIVDAINRCQPGDFVEVDVPFT